MGSGGCSGGVSGVFRSFVVSPLGQLVLEQNLGVDLKESEQAD